MGKGCGAGGLNEYVYIFWVDETRQGDTGDSSSGRRLRWKKSMEFHFLVMSIFCIISS